MRGLRGCPRAVLAGLALAGAAEEARAQSPSAIDVRRFGYIADDRTNVGPAINAAMATCPAEAAGCEIALPPGRARLEGTVVVTRGMTFRGAGHSGTAAGLEGAALSGTVLISTTPTGDVFSIQTQQPVTFRDLELTAVSQRTAGAGIAYLGDRSGAFAYARDPLIDNVKFRFQYDAVDFRYANSWRVTGSLFQDFRRYGVNVSQSVALAPDARTGTALNAAAADYGDWEFSGNRCQELDLTGPAGPRPQLGYSDACLHMEATGSGVIQANKFLGSKRGVDLELKYGPTGTVLISNNSFEQQTIYNIDARQGAPQKDFAGLSIVGNQFANQVFDAASPLNPQGNIHVGRGVPAAYDARWIRNVVIADNSLNNGFGSALGSRAMIQMEDGQGVIVAHNVATDNARVRPGAVESVPLLEMGDRVVDAQAAGNVSFLNPGGAYGRLGRNVQVSDADEGASRVRGDSERVVAVEAGASRIRDVTAPLAGVADWTTLRALKAERMSGLTAYGTASCTLQGLTQRAGYGSRRSEWDFSLADGRLAASVVGADKTAGLSPPGVRLLVAGSSLLLQAKSADGASPMTSGLADCRIRLPDAEGGGLIWTVSTPSPPAAREDPS